ncbi:unnamed protein product [Blepharisma stoltei]|uniref:Mitochondrial import inner membrane translocase subunit TIM14 n=1 Tax=Blepharisma stoltei TaxID=1481888 RepID=A0AAU9KGC5_9CILI|nr:unnamed protein product [Blepharisma stoltei]
MSKYAVLVGMALVFTAAAGKVLIKGVRQYKMNKAAGTPFDSSKIQMYMGAFNSPMTRREAALILGVREGSSEEVIIQAHKRLMLLNHPDYGGSTYVAMKINEAKDLLILK